MERQEALPGMEDRKIAELHNAALDYAEARDARIAASTPEAEKKQALLALMKKHKREHYQFENVEVYLVHEKENVKVQVSALGEPGSNGASDGKAAAANDDSMPELPAAQRKAVKRIKPAKKRAKK